MAAAYIRQALDSTGYTYSVYEPDSTYSTYSDEPQTSISGSHYVNWLSSQTYQAKDSNLLLPYVTEGENHASSGAAESGGIPYAIEYQGWDVNKGTTNVQTSMQNTQDSANGVLGCLHEVEHNLIDDSISGYNSHLTGENWFTGNEYHVRPMFAGYDKNPDYYNQENYCGTDYLENNPGGYDVYYELIWASCMMNNIVPE